MPHWLIDIPIQFWHVLAQMSPYLLFGFFVAGLLSIVISPRLVEKHLGGNGFWPIVKASAFGVPLPLCSCGVIPVSASLRQHGASRAATTAFLISTPQTGADSIFITYSLLGPVFAIFRPIAALISGAVGGLAAAFFARGDDDTLSDTPPEKPEALKDDGRGKLRRLFEYGFVELPRDIGRALLIGLVIAALISALVPKDFFRDSLGGFFAGGIGAMLVMMVMGIPVYVCASASVPWAAALVVKGLSPGAALVFLMTGPATNAATIAMVWKLMGKRTAVVYLLAVAGTALASGLLLDYVFQYGGFQPAAMMHGPHVKWWETASAIVLLILLGYALLKPMAKRTLASFGDRGNHSHRMTDTATAVTLGIDGMTCNHCAKTVQRALAETPGVETASVDLDDAKATVTGATLDTAALRRAVESVGYKALPPQELNRGDSE